MITTVSNHDVPFRILRSTSISMEFYIAVAINEYTSQSTTRKSNIIFRLVEHPFFKVTNFSTIRVSLCAIDQFARKIQDRPHQLSILEASSEAFTLLHFKFRVDIEWIEGLLTLNFLVRISPHEGSTNNVLGEYLKQKPKESKRVFSLIILDNLLQKELYINMSNRTTKFWSKNLFVLYHKWFRGDGPS